MIHIATPDPEPARALAALQMIQAMVVQFGHCAIKQPSPQAMETYQSLVHQMHRRAAELALATRN